MTLDQDYEKITTNEGNGVLIQVHSKYPIRLVYGDSDTTPSNEEDNFVVFPKEPTVYPGVVSKVIYAKSADLHNNSYVTVKEME